jgi:CDP-diacylglycerol--glycerol-3-phosphate 3-phosphatidyltransferase
MHGYFLVYEIAVPQAITYPKDDVGMLMTNENVRLYPHDRIMAATVLRFIPHSWKPNHFTVLRFLSVPFVLYFLWSQAWSVALPLFFISAFTDSIDGSLARTRKQITLWGTVADPVADKLLIAPVALLFVARQIHPLFALLLVFLELGISIAAYIGFRRVGYASANIFGKVKMCLQVAGVVALLIGKIAGLTVMVPIAIVIFGLALIFGITSMLTYGF